MSTGYGTKTRPWARQKAGKQRTAHAGLVLFFEITVGQSGHHVAGSDEHPLHTSSTAPNHKTRSDNNICQRKGWDKFTQEISNTNNHNRCLFPLLLVLKCQEILPEGFPPLDATGSDLSPLLIPRNVHHMLAIMKSFSATRNTIHFEGKKIN